MGWVGCVFTQLRDTIPRYPGKLTLRVLLQVLFVIGNVVTTIRALPTLIRAPLDQLSGPAQSAALAQPVAVDSSGLATRKLYLKIETGILIFP